MEHNSNNERTPDSDSDDIDSDKKIILNERFKR